MIALSMSLGVGNGAAKTASGPLTPPTVAPVLIVSAASGSTTANLEWTASDKTSSAGFGYQIERENASVFSPVGTTTSLVFNEDIPTANGETYTYRVTPYNAAGNGPASNTASVTLPGI
jgi:hypothetical protein